MTRDGKFVCHGPTCEPRHQGMALACSFQMVILDMVDLTPPSDGMIYIGCKQDSATPDKHYHVTVNKYSRCSCASILKMHNFNVGDRQPCIPCKHMLNLFMLVLHVDEEDDEFIHNSTWSPASLEKLLSHDPML